MRPTCPECGRVFDLFDGDDANEWAHGHDCEAERFVRDHVAVIPVVIPEARPRCDLCGRDQDDSPNTFSHEVDWNGETGNHTSCEIEYEAARRSDPYEVYGTPEHEALLIAEERGEAW